MSDRARQILARFPAHLDVARPGKLIGDIAEALAFDLDVESAELAGIRRSHRLQHVDTPRDLLLMAALHGLERADFGLVWQRASRVSELLKALVAASDRDTRIEKSEAIFELFGVAATKPRILLFANSTDTDLSNAEVALQRAAENTTRFAVLLDSLRRRLGNICEIHARGNGTCRAIIEAAANALDLDLDLSRNRAAELVSGEAGSWLNPEDELVHSRDSFWHASYVTDRIPLVRDVPTLVPEKLVTTGGPAPVIIFARQMNISGQQALEALAELGIVVKRDDATLDVANAEKLAQKFGFEFELVDKGRIEMSATIRVRDLGARTLLPTRVLLERLSALGKPSLTPDSLLDADSAAAAVRKYGFTVQQSLSLGSSEDVLGIEENPLREEKFEAGPLAHAGRFSVSRRGFDKRELEVHVKGIANHTYGPMLVNRDEGRGIGFAGVVPEGETLIFLEDGHVLLSDGTEVTENSFSWRGGCFADADEPNLEHDFVFEGAGISTSQRPAKFVVATPTDALDREMEFPHAEDRIFMPGIGLGKTRFAFFVQEASFASRTSTGVKTVTPRTGIGYLDASVFAAMTPPKPVSDPHPDSDWVRPPAGDVTLIWREHEGYALRVLIPKRFSALDAETFDTKKYVRAALERVRPVGVDIRVDYIDEVWTLGEGSLPSGANGDPLLTLRGGTILAPVPPP